MYRSRGSLSLHYAFRAALTGGFAFYIVHLVRSDKLLLYIAPKMETFVKLAAVALSMIAVYFAFAAFRALSGEQAADCGCEHGPSKSAFRNVATYLLFAAPLLFGWFVPDTIMGSNLVDKKGIVLSVADSDDSDAEKKTSNANGAPTEGGMFYSEDLYEKQYSSFAESLYLQDPIVIEASAYLEASTAIDLFLPAFLGKRVEIVGFVYKQEDMTDRQFVVARLAMECCSADSTPYGFLVDWPDAAKLAEDQWVTVEGVIRTTDYGGIEIASIAATRVTPVETPSTPYVYPNYDILE
ncbi:TIGR03943 family putative permease subunit [Paenibacillus sp.]|uniref:TIGR03943 family putative permease subunit n=1 Tax=Paenibacillus sp. TaxID=58172 RepID=UPI002D619929|nr:TIGR03943 family protein [Paenibacillus sp.]HZG56980.1 TIGR03943 family protein [Paenibacillus sp.]